MRSGRGVEGVGGRCEDGKEGALVEWKWWLG